VLKSAPAVVFLVALGLRAALFVAAQGEGTPGAAHLDSARFVELAAAVRAGEGVGEEPYATSPLYPYLLALFPGVERAESTLPFLRGLQLLLGALTCALVACAAGRRFGPRAGWIAGLLLACYAPAMHYENQVLVAGPLGFLLATALVLAPGEGETRRAARRGAGAGIAVGLAAALRPTALAPGLALGVVLAAGVLRRRVAPIALVAFLLGLLAAVAPFTLRNHLVGGEPVLLSANGGFNFWVGNHRGAAGVFDPPAGYDFQLDPAARGLAERGAGEELSATQASRWWRERALEDVGADPADWLALTGRKLLLLLGPAEIPQLGPDDFQLQRDRLWPLRAPVDARWLLLLALAAPFALGLARRRGALEPAVMAAAYGAVVVLFFVSGRFRAPLLPLAAVLAAGTVEALIALLSERSRRRAGAALAGGLLLLGLLSLWVYRSGGPYSPTAPVGEHGRQEALLLLREGRAGEAIPLLQALLEEGEDATTRATLAHALALEGRPGEAAQEYRRVLAAEPQRAQAALELGNLIVGPLKGDTPEARLAAWREAEPLFAQAVEHQPRFAVGWFHLGVARLQLRRFEAAEEALEKALELGQRGEEWRAEAERALEIARGRGQPSGG